MMSKAIDTPIGDILISPCLPVVYNLGPFPVMNRYLITRDVAEYYTDQDFDHVFIEKKHGRWLVSCLNDYLSQKTNDFVLRPTEIDEDNDEFLFDSMVEAKEFWYETYLKNLLKTCTDEDSDILGVWLMEEDETGERVPVKHDW
jgi:hypothetical protein